MKTIKQLVWKAYEIHLDFCERAPWTNRATTLTPATLDRFCGHAFTEESTAKQIDDNRGTKMTRNMSTPENRAFWDFVKRTAEQVRHWPAWAGGEAVAPVCCPTCGHKMPEKSAGALHSGDITYEKIVAAGARTFEYGGPTTQDWRTYDRTLAAEKPDLRPGEHFYTPGELDE